MVLRSGGAKMALVSVDLFASPGGLIAEAAERAGHGFSERNVLVCASHTHSGPSQFANFPTLNTLAPSTATITNPATFIEFLGAEARRSAALHLPRQADRDGAAPRQPRPRPGHGRLGNQPAARRDPEPQPRGAPRRPRGHRGRRRRLGRPGPGRLPAHDRPAGRVLRVDRLAADGSRTPIGAWSTFANHGTVNPSDYGVYTQDHQGTATRFFEAKMRRAGKVPKREPVIDVFANAERGRPVGGAQRPGAARTPSASAAARARRCSRPGARPAGG